MVFDGPQGAKPLYFQEMIRPWKALKDAQRPYRRPLTAGTGVRFPLGLPVNTLEKSRVFLF